MASACQHLLERRGVRYDDAVGRVIPRRRVRVEAEAHLFGASRRSPGASVRASSKPDSRVLFKRRRPERSRRTSKATSSQRPQLDELDALLTRAGGTRAADELEQRWPQIEKALGGRALRRRDDAARAPARARRPVLRRRPGHGGRPGAAEARLVAARRRCATRFCDHRRYFRDRAGRRQQARPADGAALRPNARRLRPITRLPTITRFAEYRWPRQTAKKRRRLQAQTEVRSRRSKAEKYVYFFGDGKADGNRNMKDLLGGKGSGLAEMTNAGLPVPPGFTISTEVCNIYYKEKQKIPGAIDTRDRRAPQEAREGRRRDARLDREPAARLGPLGREVLDARA